MTPLYYTKDTPEEDPEFNFGNTGFEVPMKYPDREID